MRSQIKNAHIVTGKAAAALIIGVQLSNYDGCSLEGRKKKKISEERRVCLRASEGITMGIL